MKYKRTSENRLLRDLLKNNKKDESLQTYEILSILNEVLPLDEFSRSQWNLGLEYYRKYLEKMGATGEVFLDLGHCGKQPV
jgi:hypothetical protein